MRELDPFDPEDLWIFEQIALDNDLPLKFLLKSTVRIEISLWEISFNVDLGNLEGNIIKELSDEDP